MPIFIDPIRAELIQNEYRFTTVSDSTVRAIYSEAVEVTMDTNLDEADAVALAQRILNASSKSHSGYTFEYDDLIYPEDMITAPPRFELTTRSYSDASGKTFTLVSATPDFNTGRTLISVRQS